MTNAVIMETARITLEALKARIRDGYLCKSDKEIALREQRRLEGVLGIEGENYNGR